MIIGICTGAIGIKCEYLAGIAGGIEGINAGLAAAEVVVCHNRCQLPCAGSKKCVDGAFVILFTGVDDHAAEQ